MNENNLNPESKNTTPAQAEDFLPPLDKTAKSKSESKPEPKKQETKEVKKDEKKDPKKSAKLPLKKKAKKKTGYVTFGNFSIREQVHFAKRLAFLVTSGVPILDSLKILHLQTRSKRKALVQQSIVDDVSNGKFLSQALARHSQLFGEFGISVIRVGEVSGNLSQNLRYLAEELQKRHALRRKIIGALVYPAFITVATIGISVLLTAFIFPKIMPIFTSLNVHLPLTTRILIYVSDFLRDFGLYTLAGIVIFIIALIIGMKKSKPFHYFVARNILRLPLLGGLIQNYNLANFCRTLSLLLKSGYNVVEAAVVAGDSTPNPVYKKECQSLQAWVSKGNRISKHLEASKKLFPDIVIHMVAIGETSGTLPDSLFYLSEHYEEEVDDLVKNLSSSIEPVLMVFMGLIVGFVAVSVITPIYEITQSLQR